MAEIEKKENQSSLIDPIYEKFVRGVTRAIGSTDFYEFFMDAISRAQNEFQFSNRKMIKNVDLTWVDAIEEALEALQNVVSSPRNVIKEEDLIVNVAHAKRSGAETVRHLAMHSGLVESFDEETGDLRPAKLMQRFREESLGMYENRLVFTTMEYAYHFVKIRHDALFEAMSDEFGAKLKVQSDMDSATEHVHMDMFLHIKEIDSALETDKKNGETFNRISRIYRILGVYMNSTFAQQMSKQPRVKGTINRTNILKKNPDYRKVVKLFEFLKSYTEIGYTIRIVEQNPEINERFQQDIYRNILFNYLILKGYLEDEEDREVPVKAKGRKRTLKPKFIHEIVEELTEDYDLPDVEIRKVLIEELTKEQLMKEEAAERRRLVEEQEKKKKEEAERLKAEKKAEAERRKAEAAAEAERRRLEKEAEEARKRQERMQREAEERRRKKLFIAELDYFHDHMEEQLQKRAEAEEAAKRQAEQEDYANAVRLLEEEEQRKQEEKARERQRRKDEKERLEYERRLAEEAERRAKLEEEERQRQEQERLRREQEEEAARLAEEDRQQALIVLMPLVMEMEYVTAHIEEQQERRIEQAEAFRRERDQIEQARLARSRMRNQNVGGNGK
jgi:hypothetical protein